MTTVQVGNRSRRVAVMLVAGLALSACADKAAEEKGTTKAARVEAIKGSKVSRVILATDAARRIGVRTEAVAPAADGHTQVAYAAVFYDPQGATWAFVNLDGLTFVRERIEVERIEGDVAVLADGPPAGTKVVTVGAAELYGAENGVGDDE